YPDADTKASRRNINGSWNPFSTSLRNCIGHTLVLAELRTVLAVMIGNFFFELPEGVHRERFYDEEQAQRARRYDVKDIPGPKQLPFIGNLGAVFGSSHVHRILALWTNTYGSVFKWSIAGQDMLVITDPEEVSKLCSRDLNLPKSAPFYKGLNHRAPHNDILATPDYHEWKYLRKMTNPAFSSENIRKRDAEVINLVAFGEHLGALEFEDRADGTVQLVTQEFLKHLKRYQDDLTVAFTNPLFALLLWACPWHPRARQAKATFLELTKARVRKELSAAGLVATPGHPPLRHLDFADLSKLRVLDAVIKETLRLHGPAPIGTVRETDKDMVIKGYRVPKGMALMLSPHPMHVSSQNYLHPDKFWPERWVSDTVSEWNPDQAAHPDATTKGNQRNINGSWNPFSCGPRNCIGQTLALAELRTVLAVMIGNFFFELPKGVQREAFIKEEEVWWVTLQAKNGVHLNVQPIMGETLPEPKGPKSDFFYEELTRLAKEAEEEAGKH
ncbi:MAG: cytochrome P450, partial [Trebouxia sp. A1-2]